jgi:hypothetical protein
MGWHYRSDAMADLAAGKTAHFLEVAMTSSAEVCRIQASLIEARTEVENLNPSAKGYGYDYVPLEKVIDHLKAVLPKHGLGYIQLPTAGSADTVGLSTRIIHASGEWIEDTAIFKITDMKGVNVSQASGSALTYFRRYALCAAFGITGDKDVDAVVQGAQYEPEIKAIEKAASLDELKSVFEAAWKMVGEDNIARAKLTSAKDKRKRELS